MKITWKYPLGGTFSVNSGNGPNGSSLVGFLTQTDFLKRGFGMGLGLYLTMIIPPLLIFFTCFYN